ncbi:MAG: VCBS repeat-containing protein [Planctomycetes bacterium]|nr:VCBS repeat-containing protein [Planctomycetota bacterium]
MNSYAADIAGDGAVDLALGAGHTILVNHGDGTFGEPVTMDVPLQPESIAVGDLDGDGVQDLVGVASSDVTTLLARG